MVNDEETKRVKEDLEKAKSVIASEESHVVSLQSESYFKPSSWLAKINYINHLVLFNTVLMVVMTEKEGGKTTFMTLLGQHLDENIQLVALSATPSFVSDDFFASLRKALPLNSDLNNSTALEKYIAIINERQTHVLVCIDDAQYLADDFLIELLSTLKKQVKKSYLHVCLLGDFSLSARLNHYQRAKFKDLIHTIEPGSLSEIETKTYVFNRLAAKGLEKALTEERLDKFYHLTSGQIARINLHLVDFFLPIKIKRPYFTKLSLVVVVLLLIVNSSYWWYKQSRSTLLDGVDARTNITEGVRTAVSDSKQQLTSIILPYTSASTRMTVQPAPFRSILLGTEEEVEGVFQDKQVLMDKVVVIPEPKVVAKTTGPHELLQSKLLPIRTA